MGDPLSLRQCASADGLRRRRAQLRELPLNLLDALRLADKATSVREQFGNSYLKMKTDEWNSFTKHLTEWERQNTLDC